MNPLPAPNFNRLARPYRWMEFLSFGPWLALTRRTYLDRLTAARHALVVGDGDGRFTARLLQTNPAVQVVAVDASATMLQVLTRRSAAHTARLRGVVADVRLANVDAWKLAESPPRDLIATHFFLDCLTTEEVMSLAVRVRALCAPGALWVVSDFAVPLGWFGRLIARPLVAFLYWAFARLTGLAIRRLPDHAGALRQAGFNCIERRSRLGGLLIAELWRVGAAGSNELPGKAALYHDGAKN
jgi:SAM-dependent methyltransferase